MCVEVEPQWKQREPGDVKAELQDLQDVCPKLYERAIKAYERYDIPAPLVVWAAKRAWAQGVPDHFALILINHLGDCYRRIPDLVMRSMIL